MVKRKREQLAGLLGPLETEVMEMVWRQGETTVRDVHAALAQSRDLAYTTIMTTMARLAAKGLLEKDTTGLAHRYRARISRGEYARSTVTSVVDWLVEKFPEPAMSYFAEVMQDSEPVTVDALRARVNEMRSQEE